MLTFTSFSGINNVLSTERLPPEALATATNVDVGLTGELRRRQGYAKVSSDTHTNLHATPTALLATTGLNGDLKNVTTDVVLYPSLGHDRVYYCDLPDGRTAFSNGLICGITDGATTTAWGVPTPPSVGALAEIAGSLFAGGYRYALTYVRLADGLEGSPAYAAPQPLAEGGVFLSGLPVAAGYKLNVYLSSHNDDRLYLAGSTTNGLFSFTGANDALVLPCRTENTDPAPAGKHLAFWRGRALVAVGSVLLASLPNRWEAFDLRRDFKQFSADITTVVPVDGGIYVGTETELAFLAGTEFDKLAYRSVVVGRVVPGSGVAVNGELVKQGEGAGLMSAMICIAYGRVVAGFSDGGIVRLTEGRYATDVAEVHATFRIRDGIPQYIAIPQ